MVFLSKVSNSVFKINCCLFGDGGGTTTKPRLVWFSLEPEGAGNLNSSSHTSLRISLLMIVLILSLCN